VLLPNYVLTLGTAVSEILKQQQLRKLMKLGTSAPI